MHWVTIIVVGIAANLDNLGISISYGIRKIKIPFISNFIICFTSMAATYLSVVMGASITYFISSYLANLIGSVLLCLIGIWTLLFHRKSVISDLDDPEEVDWDKNQIISWKESLYLGAALSLNCIASGISMGASQISPLWTTASVGIFSLATIGSGQHLGYQLKRTFLGKYSTIIGASLLILIGILELFY